MWCALKPENGQYTVNVERLNEILISHRGLFCDNFMQKDHDQPKKLESVILFKG